ncbi:SGNH/GDSL hydrolase family protein [Hymenobacter jejuensis]|uniref:T9SS type A sorting domain-containing protein n=1 Tax=Hymenobacter jejuensis TaxID=2502781 RepID=A0A5B8A5F1_9BACT|nr:SGNH/GDSL hydrolase family protein [Hymenobacter jejuensis]QDA61432.1 T9SS type A sorting domain-containing protein [Hymenobacter jejuensis]
MLNLFGMINNLPFHTSYRAKNRKKTNHRSASLHVLLLICVLLALPASLLRAQGTETGNARPILIATYGNSLVAGVGASTGQVYSTDNMTGMDFPAQLSRDLGAGYVVKNLGVPSKTTPDLAREAAGTLYPLLASDAYSRKIVVIWELTNDLCLAGASADQAFAHYKALAEDIKAHGAELILLSMLPRTTYIAGYSVQETEQYRNQINARLRTEWTAFADRLADVADLPLILPDGTHLGDAGYTIVKDVVKAHIMSLVNSTVMGNSKRSTTSFLTVYPNPIQDGRLHLDFGGYLQTVQISVFNALGREVYSTRLTGASTHIMEVPNLTTGSYWVRAQSGDKVQTNRFVR